MANFAVFMILIATLHSTKGADDAVCTQERQKCNIKCGYNVSDDEIKCLHRQLIRCRCQASPSASTTLAASAGSNGWTLIKSYSFSNMSTVLSDWKVVVKPTSWAPYLRQEYVNRSETLNVRNGRLVIRAYREDGKYYSARIQSRDAFSPAAYDGIIAIL